LFVRITEEQLRVARYVELMGEIEIPEMNTSVEDHIADIGTDGID
jgi:hypothetical protein